jgi:carbonic anhydrase/acetyltransferase-like protein (isoleucine patch superfamily)
MFSRVKYFLSALKLHVLGRIKGNSFALRALGGKVGAGSRIYTRSFGGEPWLISIGDRVGVAAGVQFITHDGSAWLLRDGKGRRYHYAPIKIGNDVLLGANAIILPGVRIGNRVIVAAGSVVSRSIPDNCVVGGVPARFLGSFDDYERRGLAEFRSEADKRGKSRRQQVDSLLDEKAAPEIEVFSSVRWGTITIQDQIFIPKLDV